MPNYVCSGAAGTVMTAGAALSTGVSLPDGITVSVTNGLESIFFSEDVSLPAGTPLVFASQPTQPIVNTQPNYQPGTFNTPGGTTGFFPSIPAQGAVLGSPPPSPQVYYLAAAIVSGVSGFLTEDYTGPNATATTVVSPPGLGSSSPYVALGTTTKGSLHISALAAVTPGFENFTFNTPVTLPEGTALTFASDSSSTYYLAASISAGTAGELTEAYMGAPSGDTAVTNVTPIATVNGGNAVVLTNNKGQRVSVLVQLFSVFDNPDMLLFFPPGTNSVIEVVGQDSTPVTLIGVPANELS